MKPVLQDLTRLRVTFDDDKAVANAGLVMTSMLAQRLGLVDLFNATVTVGDTYGGHPDAGSKAMTVVSSLLSGGEFISDIAALHAGATGRVTGHDVISASRVGQWLRAMTLGQIAQFERVAAVGLSRAWAAGAGPRALNSGQRLVLDIDGTITETYGHAKAGATRRTYLGIKGYHPLVCAEAETGQIVHSRLRAGTATSSRGAGNFVSQAFRKVRAAANDPAYPLLLRADSGFYSYPVISACVGNHVDYSITARQFPPIRHAIDQIPADAWEPAQTTRTKHVDVAAVNYLIKGRTGAVNTPIPCRLIVRRSTTPADTGAAQPRLFDVVDYQAFVTNQTGDPDTLERRHRQHARIETTIRDLKHGVALNHFPSGSFPANAAWLTLNHIAHNLIRQTTTLALPQPITTKTFRHRYLTIPGRITTSGRTTTLHLPTNWPWQHHITNTLTTITNLPTAA